MEQKSITLNTVIYSAKSVLTVIFPMVTMPYVLRVLGVENVGRYNFIQSVVSYFALLAMLGLDNYGRRDGAVIRNDRAKFSAYASEIFSLNLIITLLSYAFLGLCTFFIARLRKEALLVCVCSAAIVLATVGVEWVYSVFEDYLYITVRQIVVQVLSMALLFLFVRGPGDTIPYSLITVAATAGSNIFNFIHSRKYCDIRLTFHIDWRRHLPKSVVFFASSLMVTIYVNTDQTLLGFLCGDYQVGLYSASVKIYRVLNSILAAAAIVGCPRLSEYAGNRRKEEYVKNAMDIYGIILTTTLPAVTGVCLFSRQIVLLVAGSAFAGASSSLFILSLGLIGYVLALYWGQCVLVANGKEATLFAITAASALLNLVLNLALIPFFKQDAAAFTTLLSEALTAILSIHYGRKVVDLPKAWKLVVKCMAGCAAVIACSLVLERMVQDQYIALFASVAVSACVYFLVEILLKNEAVSGVAYTVLKK